MANDQAKVPVSLRKKPCERCGHHKSKHHCLGKCKTLSWSLYRTSTPTVGCGGKKIYHAPSQCFDLRLPNSLTVTCGLFVPYGIFLHPLE